MTTRQNAKGFPKPLGSDGSTFCLACGLCCDGVLYAHVVVKPDEIEHVRTLGLTIETIGDHFGFRQPCPLYREQHCSVYPNHPSTCRSYRCDLLKKYLAGAIPFEQGAQTVRRTRELFAAVLEQLPAGYSFGELQRVMEQDWDSGRGPFGSAEMRQSNAEFLLTVVKLAMYARKHFGKPKETKKAATPLFQS